MSALFQLFKAWPASPAAIRETLAGEDLTLLVRDSVRDRIAPLVREALREAGIALPPELEQELRKNALAITGMNLRVKALLFQTLKLFAREGVEAIPLKGYPLASRLYPEPLLRGTSDVDVLVRREDFERAGAAIQRELRLKAPSGSGWRRALAEFHHVSYVGDAGMVELHFYALKDFGTVLEAAPLFARSEAASLEGWPVRYLRAEDELVHLCAHAAHHYLERLTSLLDIKLLLLKQPKLDFDDVVANARAARLGGPVFAALFAASRMGAPVPFSALEALRPPRWRAGLAEHLGSSTTFPLPFADRKWRSYLAGTLLADTVQGRGAFALNLVKGWLRARVE